VLADTITTVVVPERGLALVEALAVWLRLAAGERDRDAEALPLSLRGAEANEDAAGRVRVGVPEGDAAAAALVVEAEGDGAAPGLVAEADRDARAPALLAEAEGDTATAGLLAVPLGVLDAVLVLELAALAVTEGLPLAGSDLAAVPVGEAAAEGEAAPEPEGEAEGAGTRVPEALVVAVGVEAAVRVAVGVDVAPSTAHLSKPRCTVPAGHGDGGNTAGLT
jgi:hypothetical protein